MIITLLKFQILKLNILLMKDKIGFLKQILLLLQVILNGQFQTYLIFQKQN